MYEVIFIESSAIRYSIKTLKTLDEYYTIYGNVTYTSREVAIVITDLDFHWLDADYRAQAI